MSPVKKKKKKTAKPKARKSATRKSAARKTTAKKTEKKAGSKTRSGAKKVAAAGPKAAKPKPTRAKFAKPAKQVAAKAPKVAKPAKKAAAKAPKVSKAPPAAPKKSVPQPRTRSPRAGRRAARRKSSSPSPAAQLLPPRERLTPEASGKLGEKWECFSCGAKFYDLNKPEPICPKCEANQHERPRQDPRAKSSSDEPRGRRSPARTMALLDDEEEEEAPRAAVEQEGLELGLEGVDEADGGLTASDDAAEEEDEEP